MNPAYLLGAFLGSVIAVTILTLIIGAFLKRPILSVLIATGAAICLSIVGNDGLEPDSFVMSLLAGVLVGTWRVVRQGQPASASPQMRTSLKGSRGRRTVIHKLYLTAFWGLAVVCGGIALYQFLVNIHDYLVVERSISCLNRTTFSEACGLYVRSLNPGGAPRFDDLPGVVTTGTADDPWADVLITSTRTWDKGSTSRDAQNVRLVVALLSPLWLVPLALLVAVRRWVLWLMREEPQAYSSRE